MRRSLQIELAGLIAGVVGAVLSLLDIYDVFASPPWLRLIFFGAAMALMFTGMRLARREKALREEDR